jgi:hypothetical protein
MYDSRVKMRSMPADVQVRIDRCACGGITSHDERTFITQKYQNVNRTRVTQRKNTYILNNRNNPPNQPRLWHSTAHTVAHDYKDVVVTLLPQEHGMYGGWLAGWLSGCCICHWSPSRCLPPLAESSQDLDENTSNPTNNGWIFCELSF